MFSRFKSTARQLAEGIARILHKTGVSPTQLTLIGFLLNLAVGVVLALGYLPLGGGLLLVVGAFDMLDGALARVANRATTFGAFLDSTLDRISEAALLLGLLIEASRHGDQIVPPLAFIVIVGSLMVSYTRARAEGLGLKNEVGIAPRPERVVILGVGLIVGLEIPALAVLAVLTYVTVIQRILNVQQLLRGSGRDPEPPRRPASQTESRLETR
ncbi:MAG TPA: CDP-alcohol phosphatidyltransferase family protein [Chloroflexota bacterium]|nr:CDP-alcohol phosphatidyltransferase family protein [Chloroflexota bacterium]